MLGCGEVGFGAVFLVIFLDGFDSFMGELGCRGCVLQVGLGIGLVEGC